MAGETIVVLGTFASIETSNAVADGAFSAGTKTSIVSALPATEEDAPLLDFKLDITAGTMSSGDLVHLYFRPSDGADLAPVPATTYKHQYVGTFALDGNADEFFLFGVPNNDKNGTYYWEVDGSTTITAQMYARSRAYNAA